MFYLIVTIILNVVITAFFKLFPKFKIDALQAIVANYCICVLTGCLFIGRVPFTTSEMHHGWFPWSLLMGAWFIGVFNLLAYNTKIDGITTATIANKLSLVIPVLFSFLLYKEQAGVGKIAGIVLAIPAVYLSTRGKGDDNKPQNLFWPVILFIGSGLLDTMVKYVQFHFLATEQVQAVYAIYCFAAAGITGVILEAVLLVMKKITFRWRNVLAGICVGIPNFFSIYFTIRTLNSNVLQSSALIPVLNIGILAGSSFVAILFFREKANIFRVIGLSLSIIAILLIALGDR